MAGSATRHARDSCAGWPAQRYGNVWKKAHVSDAQLGGILWPILSLNEHSKNSLAQLLCVTQVIALVLEWALVVVAAHELKC
jgi:hypothetical protein